MHLLVFLSMQDPGLIAPEAEVMRIGVSTQTNPTPLRVINDPFEEIEAVLIRL